MGGGVGYTFLGRVASGQGYDDGRPKALIRDLEVSVMSAARR